MLDVLVFHVHVWYWGVERREEKKRKEKKRKEKKRKEKNEDEREEVAFHFLFSSCVEGKWWVGGVVNGLLYVHTKRKTDRSESTAETLTRNVTAKHKS